MSNRDNILWSVFVIIFFVIWMVFTSALIGAFIFTKEARIELHSPIHYILEK